MPEIGYWKYVRFTDDEPLWFGTDDDITVVFDSADDRLEFRMKKDIRFEDDAGNEILTLDKVNRHVEIPVQLNVAALEEYVTGAGITVRGSLTFSGADLDLAGNLLKNPKLGTILNCNGNALYLDSVSGIQRVYSVADNLVIYNKGTTAGQVIMYSGDGAGGATNRFRVFAGSGNRAVQIENAWLNLPEQVAPATPASGYGSIYFKTDGRLYYKNDAGVEYGPL